MSRFSQLGREAFDRLLQFAGETLRRSKQGGGGSGGGGGGGGGEAETGPAVGALIFTFCVADFLDDPQSFDATFDLGRATTTVCLPTPPAFWWGELIQLPVLA